MHCLVIVQKLFLVFEHYKLKLRASLFRITVTWYKGKYVSIMLKKNQK